MNEGHAQLCSSRRWAGFIADEVLPAALAGCELGARILEIGPGYGAATEVLANTSADITAVEVDPALAAALRERFPTVRILDGRGEALPFPDAQFTAVLSFTMLHHVHTVDAQDALFAEAGRVLRAGGVFAGSDSIASPRLREFHHSDIYTPVDPDALPDRLRAAGFSSVQVKVVPDAEWFSFVASRD